MLFDPDHKKAVVFDLDGCISNDHWRRYLLNDGFDAYHAGLSHDEPANIDFLKKRIEHGNPLVFLTARPEKYRRETMAWLANHLPGVKYQLFMRAPDDERNSPDMKGAYIDVICGQYHEILAAYDDRQDVVARYRELGYEAFILDIDPADDNEPKQQNNEIAERLLKMAETAQERGNRYGKAYKRFGHVAAALWPNGITLKSPEDFMRMGALVQVLNKLVRYTNTPEGHLDSAHDMAVYATILEEVTGGKQ